MDTIKILVQEVVLSVHVRELAQVAALTCVKGMSRWYPVARYPIRLVPVPSALLLQAVKHFFKILVWSRLLAEAVLLEITKLLVGWVEQIRCVLVISDGPVVPGSMEEGVAMEEEVHPLAFNQPERREAGLQVELLPQAVVMVGMQHLVQEIQVQLVRVFPVLFLVVAEAVGVVSETQVVPGPMDRSSFPGLAAQR